MKTKSIHLFYTLPALLLWSCTKNSGIATLEEELLVGPSGYVAIDTNKNPSVQSDTLRKKIGSVFLVEQFSSKIFPSMKTALKEHPPGGVVFWNPENANAEQIFTTNADYSKSAKNLNLLPLLLSTDYEGGGLNQAVSGNSIIGIQRFTSGFTKLAHPAWLGRSLTINGNARLCYLHGAIMAKEMKSSGFNYPLATVSDIGQNLFLNRGISKNASQISQCLKEITQAFIDEKNVIFVTKHFPGLGETHGDTHEGTVVSKAKNMEELSNSLKPFIDLIQFSNEKQAEGSYSILASHGKFDVLDKENITTVSKPILTNYLRQTLGYKGITVSDAMWMGEYGSYSNEKLVVVYLKSLLAGMDLQMIAGRTFAPAVKFFRDVYDNTLSESDKTAVSTELKMNWSEIREKFIERLTESTERIERIKQTLTYAHESTQVTQFKNPKDFTTEFRNEYYQSLQKLGLNVAQ